MTAVWHHMVSNLTWATDLGNLTWPQVDQWATTAQFVANASFALRIDRGCKLAWGALQSSCGVLDHTCPSDADTNSKQYLQECTCWSVLRVEWKGAAHTTALPFQSLALLSWSHSYFGLWKDQFALECKQMWAVLGSLHRRRQRNRIDNLNFVQLKNLDGCLRFLTCVLMHFLAHEETIPTDVH